MVSKTIQAQSRAMKPTARQERAEKRVVQAAMRYYEADRKLSNHEDISGELPWNAPRRLKRDFLYDKMENALQNILEACAKLATLARVKAGK